MIQTEPPIGELFSFDQRRSQSTAAPLRTTICSHGSGIGSNQSCKWGIKWDICAPGLSCRFAWRKAPPAGPSRGARIILQRFGPPACSPLATAEFAERRVRTRAPLGVWLEEFERVKKSDQATSQTFVFVAPQSRAIGDLLVPSNIDPWPEVCDKLNRSLRGWSNYFGYGNRRRVVWNIGNMSSFVDRMK